MPSALNFFELLIPSALTFPEFLTASLALHNLPQGLALALVNFFIFFIF
jgi:hypothetical protein